MIDQRNSRWSTKPGTNEIYETPDGALMLVSDVKKIIEDKVAEAKNKSVDACAQAAWSFMLEVQAPDYWRDDLCEAIRRAAENL